MAADNLAVDTFLEPSVGIVLEGTVLVASCLAVGTCLAADTCLAAGTCRVDLVDKLEVDLHVSLQLSLQQPRQLLR